MIPQDKIEEVADRADIVEVVSGYIPLTRRGRNHVGLCPFHSEKTPSFSVSEEKNIFYCFGCHEGGSAIKFLMKHESLSFPEAVMVLARKYGIKIEETGRPQGTSLRERIFKQNALAQEYFAGVLRQSSGERAREYLKDRGFDKSIVEEFSIGYATTRNDGLISYLRGKGEDLELAERAGLIGNHQGRIYDRFRERVVFPIIDVRGRVLGFGGRTLGDAMAKYLNTPESPVFKKAEVLYGLYQGRDAVNKAGFAIVVEGYFDHLALYKAGFKNTVATMGTALTPSHIRRLKQYTGLLYLLFDSDAAGRKAATRSLDLLLAEEAAARVVLLPGGADPDDFLKEHGAAALQKVIDEAEDIMEFYLDQLKAEFDLHSPEGKGAYLNKAVPYLRKVRNEASRGHYTMKVALILGVEPRAVYAAIDAAARGAVEPSVTLRKTVAPVVTKLAEETLLRVILKHLELFSPEVEKTITAFKEPFFKAVAESVLPHFKSGVIHQDKMIEEIEDEAIKDFVAMAIFKGEKDFMDSPEVMLADCVEKLDRVGRPSRAMLDMAVLLEERGRQDLAEELLKKIKTKDI
ncbi:DNA primase [hydrothermal vent metagenome]|uniref:DNA primase n=1 Tax=hydrothermal vent metagenome TaxID=652676 RepID=A0A3B0UUU2_9ZZZZ